MNTIKKVEELFEYGDIKQVVESIQMLNNEDYCHHKIQNILGLINMNIGEYDSAEICLNKALEKDNDNIAYLLNLEYLYEKKNYYKDAKNILERLKNVSVDNNSDVSIEEINSIDQSIIDKLNNKNVLMAAYFFPPLGGSGVFRSLKFAKYLADYNWNVSVISAENPPNGWNFEDKSLCDEIPKNVYVKRINDDVCTTGRIEDNVSEDIAFLGLAFNELPNAKKLFMDVLAANNGFNFLSQFPCAALNWAHKVCKYIDEMVHTDNFDIIYTTSGPYSSHLIGYYVNKKYGIPWVADFRDEWVFNPYSSIDLSKINPAHLLLYNLESIICQSANHIICVTEKSKDNYINNYEIAENKVTCITNGYDEYDFSSVDFPQENNKKFVIYYGGLIYSKERSFEPIIQSVNELVRDKKIDKKDIIFRFSGQSDEDINSIAKKYGFENNIIVNGYQDHNIVLEEMIESDLLICLIGDGLKYDNIYPGKIFEYLRACRPILALASPDVTLGKILKNKGHGRAILSTDLSNIKEYILEQYNVWKTSEERIYCDCSNIIEFERKVLTKKLSDTFYSAMQNIEPETSKKEISSHIYDVTYAKGGFSGIYLNSYKESIYYNSWLAAIRRLVLLSKDTSIIDIGCGVGQFANMLIDYGYTNYRGLDYSKTAIDIAKKNNPDFSEKFSYGDAFTDDIFNENYEVAILFEILEHINDDMKVLNRMRTGTKVIFSVPNFPDPNHIRYFNGSEEVINRYRDTLDILDIQTIPLSDVNVLYLATAIKK